MLRPATGFGAFSTTSSSPNAFFPSSSTKATPTAGGKRHLFFFAIHSFLLIVIQHCRLARSQGKREVPFSDPPAFRTAKPSTSPFGSSVFGKAAEITSDSSLSSTAKSSPFSGGFSEPSPRSQQHLDIPGVGGLARLSPLLIIWIVRQASLRIPVRRSIK